MNTKDNQALVLLKKVLELHASRKPTYYPPWLGGTGQYYKFVQEMTQYGKTITEGQFLALLVKASGARLVAELGAETGAGTAFMASELPEEGHIWSIDIVKDWKHLPSWEKRVTTLLGDDSDPKTYPPDFPWDDIDLWFLDSEHTVRHVNRQLDLIKPHLKNGTIILYDDIFNDYDYIYKLILQQGWDTWLDGREIKPSGIALQVVRKT